MPFPKSDVVYTQQVMFQASLAGISVQYWSKPGLPNWDQINPWTFLLVDNIDLVDIRNVLYLGCGNGVGPAAVALKAPHSKVDLTDIGFIAQQMSTLTLHANKVQNARILDPLSLCPGGPPAYDAILMELPKGRGIARRWLALAYYALPDKGTLYLAGHKKSGILSVIADAEQLFGPHSILAYKKGSRIARFKKLSPSKQLPMWIFEDGITPGTWYRLDVSTRVGDFKLFSLPGVFSYDRLDPGTNLLLEHFPEVIGRSVLDVGCGYGIIGLFSARSGAHQVDMIDENLLAVASAQKNIHSLSMSNARAFPSDSLSEVFEKSYDLIATNPPFHAGTGIEYAVTQAIIRQSYQALKQGGALLLVANAFLRYEHLMQPIFKKVELQAETSRYKLWLAIK